MRYGGEGCVERDMIANKRSCVTIPAGDVQRGVTLLSDTFCEHSETLYSQHRATVSHHISKISLTKVTTDHLRFENTHPVREGGVYDFQ